MKKAIFFDRDGVLIKAKVKSGKPFAVNDNNNIEFTTNEISLFKKLKLQGYYLFLFTNQPDVARGIVSKNIVDIINAKVAKRYLLDDVFVCYHDDIDNCLCRKPKDGLITTAKEKYDLNLEKSFVIGDRWRDIDAAENSKCKSIFIDHGYTEKKPKGYEFKSNSINDAIVFILKAQNE
tara:strand:- start:260 stop:793 length:534 start_codon:yes stop_codon:yes gene_type:complete